MDKLQTWLKETNTATLMAVWVVLVVVALALVVVAFRGLGSSDEGPEPTAVVVSTPVPTPRLSGVTVVAAQAAGEQGEEGSAQAAEATPELADVTVVAGESDQSSTEVFGYGIQVHGVVGDPKYTVGVVKRLGLGWIKQQVKWHDFSPERGQMDWSGFDAIIEAAHEQNIKVMLSVVDAPKWARSAHATYTQGAPPDDYQDLADFLGQMVERYQGKIHAIEVWNEQNLDREWDTPQGVDPEAYVQMLTLAYQAIKSRDPNIIVISGALSPTGANMTDPNNPERPIVVDDMVYFDQMLWAGLLDVTDCVGAHHNGINIPPDTAWNDGYQDPTATFRGYWDNPHTSWSFKSTIWGYHDKMVAFGETKPICVTEFGWASSEGFGGTPPGFGFADDNTLEEQALFIVRAFDMLRKSGFVRLAFLWNLDFAQKDGIGPTDPNAPYSITDLVGAPRPAFEAVEKMPKP